MATKPTITGLEIEFDASLLGGTYSDGDTSTTWNDESGNANHATGVVTPKYEATGWVPTNDGAVRISAGAQPEDHFTFTGAFASTNMTWFVVGEVGANGIQFVGGSASQSHKNLHISVEADGRVLARLYDLGDGSDDLTSAAGLADEGDFVCISYRHDSGAGKILRLNKVEVADSAGTDGLVDWPDPYIARLQSATARDSRIAWISGYTTAASDAQIVDMEAYLYERFGLPYPPPALLSAVRWFT